MSNDIEKRLKGEQVHKTGPRGEALFCMTNVYQFILAVAAAAAFGDSWSGSSGCTGGRAAAASWIAPGCVVEAFPIAIAEAFPICPASFAGTDIMPAAAAAIVVIAATASTAAVAVIIAATSAVVAAATATAVISTTTPTTATMTSTSTSKSKTTHISHLLFYWFVLYHMGQSDKVLLIAAGDFSVTVLWESHKLLIKKS